jgi:hypothetical protein
MIERLENYFRNKPIRFTIYSGFAFLIIGELGKLILSLIFKLKLKSFFIWLITTNVSINLGLFSLIIFLSIIGVLYIQSFLRRKISAFAVESSYIKTEYTLTKKINDDFNIDENIDLDKFIYEITIQPSNSTNYWRFGIKFSNSTVIPDGRLNHGMPLIHLTKWLEHDWLGFTYYNENNVLWENKDKILIEKYNRTVIKIKISTSFDKTSIIVLSDQNELYYHEITRYKFGKISAWGDGNDFSISCIIKRKEKINK